MHSFKCVFSLQSEKTKLVKGKIKNQIYIIENHRYFSEPSEENYSNN